MKPNDPKDLSTPTNLGLRPGKSTVVIAPKADDPVKMKHDAVFAKEMDRRLDLSEVRTRLAGKEGAAYWRSLEELSESPEFTHLMDREFPRMSAEWHGVDRRDFLKLMGASMAMAGLTSCTRQPTELVVPYVRAPEEFIPGKPLFFATAMPVMGYGVGVLAQSQMGRPTKLEGNPDHPASLGATDAVIQASVLGMYDPDRSQFVKQAGRLSTWDQFLRELGNGLAVQSATRGAGLRILTGTVTSPSIKAQLEKLLEQYPKARWHQHEAISRDNTREGARLAFGQYVDSIYHFEKADVILSLDSNFMGEGPAHIRYAHDFSLRRDVSKPGVKMNRMYAVESVPTITGSNADHRLPLRSSDIETFTRALARELGLNAPGQDVSEEQREWVSTVASDLRTYRGGALVVVGERQPPVVHALAHAINEALDSVGKTVVHIEPVEARPEGHQESLRSLAADMEAGSVKMLIVLDANPVYDAPADLHFEQLMAKVPFLAHLGLYDDETAHLCHWHIPMAHYLEGWGDTRSYDGTVSIVQPLIAPLYDGRTIQEMLGAMIGDAGKAAHDLVKDFWEAHGIGGPFDTTWRKVLHDGVVVGLASPVKTVRPRMAWAEAVPAVPGLELLFIPDEAVWDGRYANNGWLQEMPRPLTKLTWDNVVQIAPTTAETMGLSNGDVVTLQNGEYAVEGPVWILPGHALDSVSIQLGYGRKRAGRVANDQGFNAYALRRSASPWIENNITLTATGERYPLATTQSHHRMEGRGLIRVSTFDVFRGHPDFQKVIDPEGEPPETMFAPFDYSKGYSWGMTINLNTCIGCNACLVACQAENNIPVVGKQEVRTGREMHWIRIDRYFEGDNPDRPSVLHQPVTCMHCENAPCEPVCPVGATVHNSEGLNQMVYNRCIGTRYCSNNCPYKVRRFNFMQYTDETTPQLKLVRNPNVTVRTRGVMEKCTYCVQRINAARITSEVEKRTITDGEVKTACQQACPTKAISFGNLNDPTAEVVRLKASSLNYAMLGELNVRPRTSYLAKITNPNPVWAEETKS